MYILDDGIRLNAILDRPENSPEKQPLLVIIHGFTGHVMERHILAFAKTANDLGIATLRVAAVTGNLKITPCINGYPTVWPS